MQVELSVMISKQYMLRGFPTKKLKKKPAHILYLILCRADHSTAGPLLLEAELSNLLSLQPKPKPTYHNHFFDDMHRACRQAIMYEKDAQAKKFSEDAACMLQYSVRRGTKKNH